MTDEIDYVKRSQYRFKVVKSLDNDAKMPSQIARDTEIFQNHISNVLRQLREHEIIECVNPEVKQGRMYIITEKGERVLGLL